MKNYLSTFIIFVFTIVLGTNVYADGHENPLNEAFNLQVQLCKLKDGATMDQYNAMNKDYINWSKENDVEVTFVRQTPLFSHADFNQSPGYDFIEILASSFEGSGTAKIVKKSDLELDEPKEIKKIAPIKNYLRTIYKKFK